MFVYSLLIGVIVVMGYMYLTKANCGGNTEDFVPGDLNILRIRGSKLNNWCDARKGKKLNPGQFCHVKVPGNGKRKPIHMKTYMNDDINNMQGIQTAKLSNWCEANINKVLSPQQSCTVKYTAK